MLKGKQIVILLLSVLVLSANALAAGKNDVARSDKKVEKKFVPQEALELVKTKFGLDVDLSVLDTLTSADFIGHTLGEQNFFQIEDRVYAKPNYSPMGTVIKFENKYAYTMANKDFNVDYAYVYFKLGKDTYLGKV